MRRRAIARSEPICFCAHHGARTARWSQASVRYPRAIGKWNRLLRRVGLDGLAQRSSSALDCTRCRLRLSQVPLRALVSVGEFRELGLELSLFGLCRRGYISYLMIRSPSVPQRSLAVKAPLPTAHQAQPALEATFARHETFAPRYGWLKKGYDAVVQDGAVFTRDDAALRLGVGKNMARSIRYWALAFGLVEETVSDSRRTRGSLRPSKFGRLLLGDAGWDPFLEDLGSLWLLHWNLLRLPGMATSWRHTFFEFGLQEFGVDDLTSSLSAMVQRQYPTARAADSSLHKDANCIVQMYAGGTTQRQETEESISSPFVQLDLMGRGVMPRHVSFRVGEKPGLSPELALAVALNYMERRGQSRSVSLSALLRGVGSPGLAFRLSEASLYSAIELGTRGHPSTHLGDSAGIIQLSVTERPRRIIKELLDFHYGQSAGSGRHV